MAKINKQQKTLYGALVLVIAFAAYLNWPQDTPTSTHHYVAIQSAGTSQKNDDPADDVNAHFPRYVGTGKNPFIPGVSLNDGQTVGRGNDVGAGKWQLTGIDTVDGVTSALIENSASGQSDFLKVGDTWNGLRVVSIDDDTVNLVNALGQPTQLGFAVPDANPDRITAGMNNDSPSLNQITPLPPLNPGVSPRALRNYSQYGNSQ
jgi:hypothetical protein